MSINFISISLLELPGNNTVPVNNSANVTEVLQRSTILSYSRPRITSGGL